MGSEIPETGPSRPGSERPAAPRWVKVVAIVGAVVVVLVVVLLLSGHGPARHGLHDPGTAPVHSDNRQ